MSLFIYGTATNTGKGFFTRQDRLDFFLAGYQGDVWVNLFLRNDLDWNRFININIPTFPQLNTHLPVMFQILDILGEDKSSEFSKADPVSYTKIVTELGPVAKSSRPLQAKYDLILNWICDVNNKLTKEFWSIILTKYAQDLNKIIKNAPKTTETFTVCRGVKGDFFFSGAVNHMFTNKNFISTSILQKNCLQFAGAKTQKILSDLNKNQRPNLQIITVPKGSSCLFISSISKFTNETEILFPENAIYYVLQRKIEHLTPYKYPPALCKNDIPYIEAIVTKVAIVN